MRRVPHSFVEHGGWVCPFGRMVYLMPPLVIEREDLMRLRAAVFDVVSTMVEQGGELSSGDRRLRQTDGA